MFRLPIVTFPAQVVAAKQLEGNKTKIENLLDWLANVDRDSGRAAWSETDHWAEQDAHFQEGDSKSMMGEEDEFNGNLLDTDVGRHAWHHRGEPEPAVPEDEGALFQTGYC